MAYLNSCTELDDLGKGRFRHIHHIKPIAYLENGVYKLSSANVAAYADGTYSHAVLAANIGVRIGDDGKYAIHPTRELARYVAFGGPQVKVGGKWTAVPFDKPVRKDNTVVWTREQADLKLTHIGHGLKHEMWLKNGYVPEDNLIAVAVNLVGLTRSGATLLADGVPVARIQAPVVYDADNRIDTRPIKWDVVSRDGQPYIVYTLPDLTGMAAPVVDPTLTLQPDEDSGQDTFMWLSQANSNFDTAWGARLYVGESAYSEDAVFHTLLRFNLSSIPAGATVTSATMSLWKFTSEAYQDGTFVCYRQKRAWVETQATWNSYSTGNGWGTAGGFGVDDCEQTDIGSLDIPYLSTGEKQWSLNASAVQEWVSGAMTNNGLLLKTTAELNDEQVFYSSGHATASERPKLVVEYTLPSAGGGMLLLGVG